MDFINVDTKEIRWSQRTPDFGYPWVPLTSIDMSAVTIPPTQAITDKLGCEIRSARLWTIESLVARMLARDELEDFAEAKTQKVEVAKTYGRRLIRAKILELCTEMGETNEVENLLWMMLLDVTFGAKLETLSTYCSQVRAAVIAKIQQINACTTWAELDAITIP